MVYHSLSGWNEKNGKAGSEGSIEPNVLRMLSSTRLGKILICTKQTAVGSWFP